MDADELEGFLEDRSVEPHPSVGSITSTEPATTTPSKVRSTMNNALIVTHGRSGSTLLQGILNSIAGWHIKGENDNFLYGLHESSRSIRYATGIVKADRTLPTNPWFGGEHLDAVAYERDLGMIARSVIEAGVDDSVSTVGFKEIRYFGLLQRDPSGETLTAYLEFLNRVLAPCKLIFLTRDPVTTSESAWWKNQDKSKLIDELERFSEFCRNYSDEHPSRAFHISYEQLTSRSPEVGRLFDFAGGAPSAEDLQRVLDTPHSYAQQASTLEMLSERTAGAA